MASSDRIASVASRDPSTVVLGRPLPTQTDQMVHLAAARACASQAPVCTWADALLAGLGGLGRTLDVDTALIEAERRVPVGH